MFLNFCKSEPQLSYKHGSYETKKRSRTMKERDNFLPRHSGLGFKQSRNKVPLELESLIDRTGGRLFFLLL